MAVAGPATAVTRRSGRSASVTRTGKDPVLNAAAEAVIETTCVRSAMPSAAPRIGKVTESTPAGIVTVAGTTASPVSELASVTTRSASAGVLRMTRPSIVAPSRTETVVAVTTSVGPSLSRTVSVPEAVPLSRTTPELVVGWAAMTTLRAPVARALSGALTVKDAEAALAGIVTVAGMLAAPGTLERSVTVRGEPVTTARVTVPIVAGLPSPSVTVVALNKSARETTSSSVTTTLDPAPARPSAVAVNETRDEPSIAVLSTTVIGKVADVDPAGIVTVAGTRARVGLSLWSFTTSADVVGVLRVTVPVDAGLAAFSETLGPAIDTASRATSSSSRVPVIAASMKPAAEAAIEKARGPCEIASSIAATANCTEAWPAGMVTREGMPTPAGRLVARSTTRSVDVSPLRETVAVAAEAPSPSEILIRETASCRAAATEVGAAAMATLSAVPGS